jgi:FAD/FMN-containing dehydrogenase
MAANKEKLQKLIGESSPEKKQSLLEEIFDDIGNDVQGFFSEVRDWVTGENPVVQNIETDKRHTWKNHTKNQVVQPLQYLTPQTLNDLVEIVGTAEAKGAMVRAIGSGHSFSDVVQTTDFLINTDQLNKPIELDKTLLKDGLDTSCLVHVENGIKIHQLNDYLDQRGLALPNMGGYDAQSIVGAASTSTHGSGITLGPIASFYRSIVLVGDGGIKYRIEPINGITNPAKYKAKFPDNRLIQDDEWFNTVAISMGCTGIIYSVIMEVMPKYWLKEVRTMSDWKTVKAMLIDGRVFKENRHFEVLVNPYPIKGTHSCLVTKRNITEEPHGPITAKNQRNFLTQLLGLVPGMVDILDFLFNTFPELSPKVIEEAMKGLVDDAYIDKSYKVLNLGTANNISAYSAEIGFPMKDNVYIRAVERMFEVADRMRALGNLYHTSPISLRFVKASDAYLSMMNGQDTCMIEIPVVNGTYGGFELLQHYESAMFEFSGRPHWGQVNYLTGSHDLVRRMYPNYEKWLNVYRQINAKGTFNNQFTDRCGFSVIEFKTS